MSEDIANKSDKHHCRCFRINPSDIEICKTRLEEWGFELQPGGEEDHGQVFGLRRKLMELLQIHFKVMPNGIIESELEPPPEYPGAHLNQKHSYPPHDGIPILLDKIGIGYSIIPPIPDTCNLPKIIKPDGPLKWWEMLLIGVAAVGIGYLILQIFKK
ncbi:hypothetical protein [Nitrosopumilus piranensis]|uniref:Uncharacterized protein n=1 Tax=Nitrosopumilus piranensis TaxID=1582439 RepID=A0A0C5BPT8_9ARCH|nr:hypothetical protein [Nitrosopumilus piranensis]AJM91723.1 hypothetical protein NPIRD3C_0509 [Nitrosopumilus piranensis]